MFRRFCHTFLETNTNIQLNHGSTNCPFQAPELQHLGWLTSFSQCFPVNANNIKILREPEEYYKTLLKRSKEATRRITLASLYLGTGELEKAFIQTIGTNKHFNNGTLKLSILLDYTRGSRCEKNSRTMVMPLLERNESSCNVCLYHTPYLRGLWKRLTPERFNEIFGLQHMKIYIFDDHLIISGANLSNDYFTNRQDRYIEINDKNLADFYDGLVSKVQQFSFKLNRDNSVTLNNNWQLVPYKSSKTLFRQVAGNLITNYLNNNSNNNNDNLTSSSSNNKSDTWIFPMVQMGQLGIKQDSIVTEKLLAEAPTGTRVFLATGYFNLTQKYVKTIVEDSTAEYNVLMAHPNANGFLGAKGLAGGIPYAYSLIAHNFYRTMEKYGQIERINLHEYLKPGWTYHAKGLWYYPINNHNDNDNSNGPYLTLIGSPNFGERSVRKDLETQLVIVTENKQLRRILHDECCYLYQQGLPANINRDVPKWVYGMVYMFKKFF